MAGEINEEKKKERIGHYRHTETLFLIYSNIKKISMRKF